MTSTAQGVASEPFCHVFTEGAVAGVAAAGREAGEVRIDVEVVVARSQGEKRLTEILEESVVNPALPKELSADFNEIVTM